MKASELFNEIEHLLRPVEQGGIGGWTTPERGCEFAAIVLALRPLVTVELGTWMGRGAFSLALAHRFVGKGKVWVVDPWSADASASGMDGPNAEWWGEQAKHDVAYKAFSETKAFLELDPWINVQRETSDRAQIPDGISAIIIDGNHGPQAIKDVERWSPHVVTGGVVYLDDLNWTHGNVAEAGKRLMTRGFVPLFERDQGAFYQRVRC